MKVTATIVASSAALVSLTQGACTDGYGIQASDSSIIPMNVCLAANDGATHGDGTARAYKFTCDANGVYVEEFSDYDCQTTVTAAAATNVFDDSNGDAQVTCESVANCDYYHVHEFAGSDGVACGTIADAVAADDTIVDSMIWVSGVQSAVASDNVNSCDSDGGSAFTRSSITDGYCTSPTTGTFITAQAYDDNQCITETAGSTPSTLALTSATDNAIADANGDFMCKVFVACSDAGIITSAPTTAPTEAPSAEPTEAPSAAPTAAPVPTEAPSDAPTAAPVATDAPTAAPSAAPSAAPTASPVATDAPSAAPTTATTTAAPTTASSASQLSSIVALLMASYYAIIA